MFDKAKVFLKTKGVPYACSIVMGACAAVLYYSGWHDGADHVMDNFKEFAANNQDLCLGDITVH